MIERFEFFSFFIIPANVTLEEMIGKIQIDPLKLTDYLFYYIQKYAKVVILQSCNSFSSKAFYKMVVLPLIPF